MDFVDPDIDAKLAELELEEEELEVSQGCVSADSVKSVDSTKLLMVVSPVGITDRRKTSIQIRPLNLSRSPVPQKWIRLRAAWNDEYSNWWWTQAVII